jgi:hypothetical protein
MWAGIPTTLNKVSLGFLHSLPSKYQDSASIKPRPYPSKSFRTDYPPDTFPFNIAQSDTVVK